MSEEEISQPTETTETPTETTEQEAPEEGASSVPAAEEAKPEAAPVDWRKALDEAPLDELRKHNRIAGIVGSEKPLWQQQWEAQRKADADAEAATRAREEMRAKARANPVAFADEWLGQDEAEEQRKRIEGLEVNAQQSVARAIGAAFHAIPEWAAVAGDPDHLAQLAVAVEGKTRDEVLPAWNAKAVDLVAERRASARFEAWKSTELSKEREALKAEITAELLAQSDRPDLVRAARAAKRGSWEDLPPGPEFDREYERNVLRR